MKNILRISGVIILFLSIYLINSCIEKPTLPVLTTTAVTAISYTTATSGGEIKNDGGDPIASRGICWNTSADPTTSNSKTSESGGLGTFTSNITSLAPNTTYYVRAYGTNAAGTGYGESVTFTSLQVAVPVLTTTAITDITQTSAVSGGNVTDDKGGSVTVRGVCWGTTTRPTTANSKTTDATGTGSFVSNLSGLSPGTLYYVRSYATNSVGTAYGSEISFTTQIAMVPVLTTTAITSITQNSAISGGTITSDGAASISARGICWSTSQIPTVSDSKTNDGNGTGVFTSSIIGLTQGTTYYVRAYAINSVGTSYGTQESFTTLGPPTVTTSDIINITQTTATGGGNVTADGGSTVTARGICWSINQNPTITDSKTSDGTGTGSFSSAITGLTGNTTYYVRAYATNSVGNVYGNEISFKTSPLIPVLTTETISSITATTCTISGSITSDGGGSITARGFCWSLSQNPTTSDSKTSEGTGIGAFISSLIGLAPNTTFYLRAYATNISGTGYGNEISFKTLVLKVTDFEGNVYNTVAIGTQTWMAENLQTTKYNDGTAIPLVTDGPAWALLTSPAYCWYNNDEAANKSIYGALYNWYAVTTGKLCPLGWQVPTIDQWNILSAYLGGHSISGGKLKETGTVHWKTPNTGATNESGFTALPGGFRDEDINNNDSDLMWIAIGGSALFWTSSEDVITTRNAYYINIPYNGIPIYPGNNNKRAGFSVRCIKD